MTRFSIPAIATVSLALNGCPLLPQDSTEWTIALVITAILFVAIVVMAVKTANKK